MPEVRDELRSRGSQMGREIARQYARMDIGWARAPLSRTVRAGILTGVLAPLMGLYLRRRVRGRDVLSGRMRKPVIFVANHCSHLDTPTILRSLPRRWRGRTAVAAAADYFYKSRWRARAVALVFNTIPMGRQGGGLDEGATDHVDRLIAERWNLLMFPEGTRSRDGEIGKVRSGAAVLAARHGVDLVPIWVGGTRQAMPPGQNWPRRLPGRFFSRRAKVEVRFGDPIPAPDTADRREVMAQVREFWERQRRPAAEAEAPEVLDVLIMREVLRTYERDAGGRQPVG